MSKDKILMNIATVGYTKAQNVMGCSENWYNPYYAIKQTFTYEEILSMKESLRNEHLILGAISNVRENLVAPISLVKMYD